MYTPELQVRFLLRRGTSYEEWWIPSLQSSLAFYYTRARGVGTWKQERKPWCREREGGEIMAFEDFRTQGREWGGATREPACLPPGCLPQFTFIASFLFLPYPPPPKKKKIACTVRRKKVCANKFPWWHTYYILWLKDVHGIVDYRRVHGYD